MLLFIGFALFCWRQNLKEMDRRWVETEPVKVESVCIEAEEGTSFKVRLSGPGIENVPLREEAWKQMRKVLEEHYGCYSDYDGLVSKDGKTVWVSKDISGLDLYVRYQDYYGKQRFEIVSVRK